MFSWRSTLALFCSRLNRRFFSFILFLFFRRFSIASSERNLRLPHFTGGWGCDPGPCEAWITSPSLTSRNAAIILKGCAPLEQDLSASIRGKEVFLFKEKFGTGKG
jgi:hypothetical protein